MDKVQKGLYLPRTDGLKELFKYAGEFLRRDNTGESKFAKQLEGWNNVVSGS
jgi:hypothetical protein